MLASRRGYVCRTCRAKTEKLFYYEQRRSYSDDWTSRGGKTVDVDVKAGASNETVKTIQQEDSWRNNSSHNGRQGPLIRKHAVRADKTDGKVPLVNRKIPIPQPVQKEWVLFPEAKERQGGRDGARLFYHRAPSVEQPSTELELEGLIDLHAQRAGKGRLGVKKGERNGGDGADATFSDNLDAAVEQAETDGKARMGRGGHSARPTPPRTTSTSTPLLDRTLPAKRQQSSSVPTFGWRSSSISTFISNARHSHGLHARMLHTSRPERQLEEPIHGVDSPISDSLPLPPSPAAPGGIRAQLRRWEELQGEDEGPIPVTPQDALHLGDAPYNDFARLPDEGSMQEKARKDQIEMEEEAVAAYGAASGKEGYDGSSAVEDTRFLVPGDLVEIEFAKSERESLLAVYIRSVGVSSNYAQFLTMQGKWLHQFERSVQFRLPGFADTATLDKIIPYLPMPESMADLQALTDRAYTEDLSVPREVTGPLVARIVKFHDESLEIYRRHASTLDDAHQILAHETDLWYGTLVTAASTLLKIPAASLPQAAVFAVRKALVHAGFAFNMDRRSHRQTGFFQIRSKAQVKNVEQVRQWVRQWQDDLAKTAGLSKQARSHHHPTRGAKIVYSFLEKARAIAMESRKTRQPTQSGNVGISDTRIPLSKDTDCVKITLGYEFSGDEEEILRFMESWACTNLFLGLSRIESLPPLILHATGLYPDTALGQDIGFMFLQELGTLLPYENRVRFDQHLLLPSSQHSKPLQNLMEKLMTMRDSHNFQDAMVDLRHDWKDLPVYCIDGADAHEIDDGISVEPAGRGKNGKEQHWVHIHIANPTAFFDHNHPLAKMARHMGETIYMPERTYMMLPRWATRRHFSLAPNRPCLTFSAKLDSDGRTLEQKITPGIIRNVISLTPDEIETLIGDNSLEAEHPMKTYSVGGTPPPSRIRKSPLPDMRRQNIMQLITLNSLAECRARIRKSAGGLFFDAHKPEIKVWQSMKQSGLAWDHPHRKGSRRVDGDPIIQMKTRGMSNWFAPSANAVDVLVREFMLLACEISASWCAEREIPIIYRGTTTSRQSELERERFMKEQIAPNTSDDGGYPMWLGVQYLRTVGFTALRTSPIRHGFLGMEHYSKATSPLRRYGDMILHWQIEAALRHEASTGQSLVVSKRPAGKKSELVLPFSNAALESIILGLQPRESIVSRSKAYADSFWHTMLLFRKHHFGEDGGFEGFENRELAYTDRVTKETRIETVPIFKAFISNRPDPYRGAPLIACYLMEFNITASMLPNEECEEPRLGDMWECKIEKVDMFRRTTIVKALRLLQREAM